MSSRTDRQSSSGRRVTAKDVATEAGVSPTAVSFAFNDPTRLGEATRQRIRDTADRLGYAPDTVARMLVQGRTRSLGLLLPQDIPQVMENPYYAKFLVGLGQVCHREGMTLLMIPPLRSSMLEAIPYAAVDGFVVCGLEIDRGEVAELTRRGIPFVLVDSDAPEGVPSVDVTDEAGAKAMTEHLLELGHRRIAILAFEAGPDREKHGYRGPLARRIAGIETALGEAGLSLQSPGVELIELQASKTAGFRAAEDLLTRDAPPTAVFALSDILAVGVLDAVHHLGLKAPDDVSVAGFDDQPEAAWIRPRLSTVRQPVEAKGRVAGDFLVSAIRGEEQHPHQVLQTALIVRESTGPAPSPRR